MGLAIIDKSNPTCKYLYKPKPNTFQTQLEKRKYIEKWHEYYREGKYGLSGMQLFYIQECWLKDGADGILIRPRYRDCDEWIIDIIHKEFWNPTQALGFIKRREIGLTSIGAGLLPFYTYKMFPNSDFGMTSCDKPRIFKAFSDKSKIVLENLDLDIRPVVGRSNETKNDVYLELETKVLDEHDNVKINKATFWSKETAQKESSAAGFSGTRLKAAFFDELPLHPRNQLLLRSSKACFMKGSEYNGLLLWGGTVEETLTTEQIQDFQDLVVSSEDLKHKVTLIPVWWGLRMNKAGESNEKEGMDWYDSEVERLSKSESTMDDLRAFRMNYPKDMDDLFDLGNGSKWSEDAQHKINIRVKELLLNPTELFKCRLREESGTIHCDLVDKSNFHVLEYPKKDVKYVISLDATQSTETTSKNKAASKFSITVMKGLDPQSEYQWLPVASFLERPKDFDSVIEYGIRILKWYNQFGNAKMCGELNATGGVFAERVIKEGLGRCNIVRKDVKRKGFVEKSDIWYFRGDGTIDWQYLSGNTYIKNYCHNIFFIDLLKDMQKAYGKNVDFLDSFLGCLWGFGTGDLLGDEKLKPVQEEYVPEPTLTWVYENGHPVEKWT